MRRENERIVKGVILAAGSGSRLRPLTTGISKQLLPVYDKPMIYYPLTTLILAGVTDIQIVVNADHVELFRAILGDGSRFGLSISFAIQKTPSGLPAAIGACESHLLNSAAFVILGDNLFYGSGVGTSLLGLNRPDIGALIFCKEVENPSEYGVVEVSETGEIVSIEEKPQFPKSKTAATGLYVFDESVLERIKQLKPSARGELEITDLLKGYNDDSVLRVESLPRSTVWLDTGTIDTLAQASEFVRVVQNRQNHLIGSPEEAAWRMGLITDEDLVSIGSGSADENGYLKYLRSLPNLVQ
jgi:glucose-1-phosphate thymidylyltransferase